MNHFWTLTPEVGFHFHIPPTTLTHMSIQTASSNMEEYFPEERDRKRKTRSKKKSKKFLFFLVEETNKYSDKGGKWRSRLFIVKREHS